MGLWEIVKTLASLALVLALMGALLWTLRRLQNKIQAGTDPNRRMRMLESMGVGPRQKIMLMQVDGQRLLIGVTAQQIQTLGQWPVEADSPAPHTESPPHA